MCHQVGSLVICNLGQQSEAAAEYWQKKKKKKDKIIMDALDAFYYIVLLYHVHYIGKHICASYFHL